MHGRWGHGIIALLLPALFAAPWWGAGDAPGTGPAGPAPSVRVPAAK